MGYLQKVRRWILLCRREGEYVFAEVGKRRIRFFMPSCVSRPRNVKSRRFSILPLIGDHSEKTMYSGFLPTVFSVKASPQIMFRFKDEPDSLAAFVLGFVLEQAAVAPFKAPEKSVSAQLNIVFQNIYAVDR